MTAGLPGFGLSGAFFLVSALLMVPIELVATLRGRSSLARWGTVLRSAAIALAIIAGIELTYAALHLVVTQLSGSATATHGGPAQPLGRTAAVVHAIPVLPVVGTLGLVAILMVSAKVAELLSDLRRRRAPAVPDRTIPSAGPLALDSPRTTRRPHTDLVAAVPRRGHLQPQPAEQ